MPGAFANLLGRLANAEVRCLVVGGVAVFLQGYSRATRDLNIIVEASPENARRLLDVLEQWGEGHARELSVDDIVPAATGALRIGEDFVLDVFTLMRARGLEQDLDYETLRADADTYLLEGGARVEYLSAERLIDLKTGTGRPKDEADISVLREILIGRRSREAAALEFMEPDQSAPKSSNAGDWPVGTE